jgi:hypothetical protein
MITFIFNLGMGGSPVSAKEAIEKLNFGTLSPLVKFSDMTIHDGEFEGEKEVTVVGRMTITASVGEYTTAKSVGELMCSSFSQRCIAIREEGTQEDNGAMVWHPKVHSREIEFDKRYFIDPFRVKMEAEAYGNKVYTIGDLRRLTSHLSDDDLLVIEIHEGERYEDLYTPTTDLIDGVELGNGKIVKEFRLCI